MSMKVISNEFIDVVNQRCVYKYEDKFGEHYLAQSKFGMRVKIS